MYPFSRATLLYEYFFLISFPVKASLVTPSVSLSGESALANMSTSSLILLYQPTTFPCQRHGYLCWSGCLVSILGYSLSARVRIRYATVSRRTGIPDQSETQNLSAAWRWTKLSTGGACSCGPATTTILSRSLLSSCKG